MIQGFGARRWRAASALAGLVAVGAGVGYLRMFSSFAAWDDEGYLLVSLRSFLGGGALYDQVYSQYGPFYYLAMGGVFEALGLVVNHDNGRLVSLGMWLLASSFCGGLVRQLTGALWVGAVVFVLTFSSAFHSMPFEPMHPGVLVCLLLAGLAGSIALMPRWPRVAMGLQGALSAALLLVKINVGGLALMALALAHCTSHPDLRRARVLGGFVATVALATPILLMNSHLGAPWAQRYVALATVAILAIVVQLWRSDPLEELGGVSFRPLVVSAFAVAVVACGLVLLGGTTLQGLLDGILLGPLGHSQAISVPLAMPPTRRKYVFLVALVAVLASLPWPTRWRLNDRWRLALGGLARCAAGAALAITASGIYIGKPRGFFLAPLAALAIAPPFGASDNSALRFARRLLPPLAVLQILHAYPVAGSQVHWSAYLLLPVAGLLFSDGTNQLQGLVRLVRQSEAAVLLRTVAAWLVVIAAGGGLIAPVAASRKSYREGVAMNLAGFVRARLPAWTASDLASTTEWLRANCTSFYSMPGLNSFHLWTGLEPRTGLNGTRWPLVFDDARQRRVLDAIGTDADLCVLRAPTLIEDWTKTRSLPNRPLLSFFSSGFETRAVIGPYELAKRPARQRPSHEPKRPARQRPSHEPKRPAR